MADEPITNQLTQTGQDIQQRLKFVGFGPNDAKRVRAIRELVVQHADEFTAAFFDHLKNFGEASALMKDAKALETARRMKGDHIKAMADGEYGPEYVEERLKLGALYAKANLDVRVFLGAFHYFMRAIGFKVMEKYKKDPAEGFENFMSLKKVGFFDLGLIVDSIVHERERVIRRQQEAIRELSTPSCRSASASSCSRSSG